ncbi:MAG: IPT/TIG domain-containing protein [Myxococcota bacterium]|nr:IPT/TIG domain-containing protein [Myxococcota bacterium]
MKASALMLVLGGCNIGLYAELPLNPDEADSGVIDTSVEEADADTDADTDTDIDIDTGLDSLDVTQITPPYGTTAGGSQVVIDGGPFDSSAVVYFGDEVAGISSISGSSITVITPEVTSESTRSVTVITDTHGGKLKNAFDYYQDGAGLAGAIGSIFIYDYVGNYWKGGGATEGFAELTFVVPTDFHYWEFYAPTMDSCQPYGGSYAYGGELLVYELGVSALTVTPSSGTPTSLTWDEKSLFFRADSIAGNQYTKNAFYDLTALSGGALSGMAVNDILRAGGDVTVSQPAIQGNNPPDISRNQSFRWSSGSADWILIYMLMYDTKQQNIEQGIICVVADDGMFDISSSEFSSWPTGRRVDILFTPVREYNTILPHNDSESRIAGMYQMYGAGFSR